MMKKALCAAATLAFASALSARAEAEQKPDALQGERERPPITMDKDGDGKVTVAEFVAQSAEFSKTRFGRADADGDGKVTPAELDIAREKQAAFATRPGHEGRQRPEIPAFAAVDTNKDGAITPEEFAAYSATKATEKAKSMDKNGDGILGKDEMPTGGGPGGLGSRVRGVRRDGPSEGPPSAP